MSRSVTPNGAKIVELRTNLCWSQEELAAQTKFAISTRTLSSVENNTPCQKETVRFIAEALSVEPALLILKEEPPAQFKGNTVSAPLTFDTDFSQFDQTELVRLMIEIAAAIRAKGDIEVVSIRGGSVIVVIKMLIEDWYSLYAALTHWNTDPPIIIDELPTLPPRSRESRRKDAPKERPDI